MRFARWTLATLMAAIFVASVSGWVLSYPRNGRQLRAVEICSNEQSRRSTFLAASMYRGQARLGAARGGRHPDAKTAAMAYGYLLPAFNDDDPDYHVARVGRFYLSWRVPSGPYGDAWLLHVGFPFWSSTLLSAALGTYLIRRFVRDRRARLHPTRCKSCGYDLRAGHEKCPECGAESHVKPEVALTAG